MNRNNMSSKTSAFECSKCAYIGPPDADGTCPKCGGAWKHIEVFGTGNSSGHVKGLETKSSQVKKNSVFDAIDVSFPQDFLLPSISLDDVPAVKLWSARFFVKQLFVLWSINVPVQFPNRLVLVSLLDAIMGEVYSAKDALCKKLAEEIRSRELKLWERRIFEPLNIAMSDDNWLDRIKKLRNQGLHGSYLPENIRIGGSPPLDLRLVGYESGIVENTSLPKDFELICQKLQDLIQTSMQLIETSLQERMSAGDSPREIVDWFAGLDTR